MTIRILKAQKINGQHYAADVVVIGLDKEVEARAIEGGGAVLVSSPVSGAGILQPVGRVNNFLPTDNPALWDDRSGAGLTVSVDPAVTFGGRAALRLDIPAGSSGTYRVGTTGAVCDMPYNWDGKGMQIVVMSSNTAAVDGSFALLGDASYTNFNTFGGLTGIGNMPQANWVANEWMVGRCTVITPTGSPTFSGKKRLRVNFNVTSQPTATTVWIGFVGVVAPKKTAVVVSIDDGYRTGYTFVADLARYYKIPVSFGIDAHYVRSENPTFMTEGMIRELHADESGLFEFVTHGINNTNLSAAGSAAAYVAQQVECRAYLRSLGILGDGPNHHPWVQSIYSNEAVAALKAAGFLSARIGGAGNESAWDGLWYTGQDKLVYQQVACISPTSGVSLATAQSNITAAVTEGYGITHLNMHQAGTVDATSPMTWSYDKWIDIFGWLAAQRDAGVLDVKTWGQSYADAVGARYVK